MADDLWDQHNGLYFDRQGRPITLRQWGQRFQDMDYKRVALTEFPDGRLVSTVWLGLDHNWGAGPPAIFETMVFGGEIKGKIEITGFGERMGFQSRDEELCERYATEEEARAGHERICAAIRQMRVSLDLAIADAVETPDDPDRKLGDEPPEGD